MDSNSFRWFFEVQSGFLGATPSVKGGAGARVRLWVSLTAAISAQTSGDVPVEHHLQLSRGGGRYPRHGVGCNPLSCLGEKKVALLGCKTLSSSIGRLPNVGRSQFFE